jgi:hypothetical protein
MATFLDIGLLEFFLPAFYILFIFVILFALLRKSKLLGDNKYLDAIFAIAVTFIIMFSGSPLELINFVTPWYAFLVVFLFMLFLVFAFIGLKEGGSRDQDSLMRAVGGAPVILIVAVIILMIGMTNVFGNVFFPNDEDGVESTTLKTLFHPRVLGAFIILIIVSLLLRNLDEWERAQKKEK